METPTVPTTKRLNPSDFPTEPAPRPSVADRVDTLVRMYRAQSARVSGIAALLKEMGIDPNAGWNAVVPDAPADAGEDL